MQYPLAADRTYDSPELPAAAYLGMLDAVGFARGVLVTASAYGTDNRAMLHALRASPARLRGVAVLDRRVPHAELAAMHVAGVRGARFGQVQGFTGAVGFDELDRMALTLRELGWHAQVWTPLALFIPMADRLLGHGVPLVLDHMALPDVAKGISNPSFQTLLRLLGNGKLWVKLTAYRLSQAFPDYEDVRPFHDALVATNPDQLIWGSDWPHVHMTRDMPDDGHLVDLFNEWVGDAVLRKKILVDNPARLYGF
ncbi:MAG: amidohydrolase family protein [Deltaproteobacteria bacterium]|nr:amidohydrolase family protein [Deltaproteobacteria bacterium]